MTDHIELVRRYFDAATNERVTDEQIEAALDYFKRDSQRHMLAARSIVKALYSGGNEEPSQ